MLKSRLSRLAFWGCAALFGLTQTHAAGTLSASESVIKGFTQYQAGRIENLILNHFVDDLKNEKEFRQFFPKTARALKSFDGTSGKRLIPLVTTYFTEDLEVLGRLASCLKGLEDNPDAIFSLQDVLNKFKKGKKNPAGELVDISALLEVVCEPAGSKQTEQYLMGLLVKNFSQDNKLFLEKTQSLYKNATTKEDKRKVIFKALYAKLGYKENYSEDKIGKIFEFINSTNTNSATDLERLFLIDRLRSEYRENDEHDHLTLDESEVELFVNLIWILNSKQTKHTLAAIKNEFDKAGRFKSFEEKLKEQAIASEIDYGKFFEVIITVTQYFEDDIDQPTAVYIHQFILALESLGYDEGNNAAFNRLKNGGLFLAEVKDAADVGNADGVEKAIDHFVDENQVYANKRQIKKWNECSGLLASLTPCARNSVFLSSYFGVSIGKDDSSENWIGRPFGPVGLEYKLPSPRFFSDYTWTVSFSPYDLGAYINSELEGDEFDPEFGDIQAPSIFFAFSGRNKPFAVIVGYQEDAKVKGADKDDIAFISVAFDLPLITLY